MCWGCGVKGGQDETEGDAEMRTDGNLGPGGGKSSRGRPGPWPLRLWRGIQLEVPFGSATPPPPAASVYVV